MLNRRVITEYWCSTCGYHYQDNGITDRPGKVLDLRIVNSIVGIATGKTTAGKGRDVGDISQVDDKCPACSKSGVAYTKER